MAISARHAFMRAAVAYLRPHRHRMNTKERGEVRRAVEHAQGLANVATFGRAFSSTSDRRICFVAVVRSLVLALVGVSLRTGR